MSDQSGATPQQAKRSSGAFAGVATLLIGATLVCGFFAGLAGKKIGNEHVEFVISYIFLGVVVVLIFGLAWVDSNTRGPDSGQRLHH